MGGVAMRAAGRARPYEHMKPLNKDPQVRRGARGESRTPTPFRAPDPKVAAARHGSLRYVSSCVVRCPSVPPVSFRREQSVSRDHT